MLLSVTEEEIALLVILRISRICGWRIIDPETGQEFEPVSETGGEPTQGAIFRREDADHFEAGLCAVVDYRGDATLIIEDGDPIECFVFSRSNGHEDALLCMIKNEDQPRTVTISTIRGDSVQREGHRRRQDLRSMDQAIHREEARRRDRVDRIGITRRVDPLKQPCRTIDPAVRRTRRVRR